MSRAGRRCCRFEGMTRRNILTGAAVAALSESAMPMAEGASSSVYLELKTYLLHNSPEDQSARLIDYLEKGYSAGLSRAGQKLIGAFTNHIGMEAPYILTITQYNSLADLQGTIDKLAADSEYQRTLAALETGTGYPYQREESSLLKTFQGMIQPLLSSSSDQHPPRFFEMRRYESQTEVTLARKVRMFNGAEIGIFERLGMRPVFFGETIIGSRMPNLVYMLSFDDLAAREQLWKKFGSDPEWKKISSPAELHDDRIVSNISNAILRPLSFSLIR
jgi:NIPSNAP protein